MNAPFIKLRLEFTLMPFSAFIAERYSNDIRLAARRLQKEKRQIESWLSKGAMVAHDGIYLKTALILNKNRNIENGLQNASLLRVLIRTHYKDNASLFSREYGLKSQQVQRWLSGGAHIVFCNGVLFRRCEVFSLDL